MIYISPDRNSCVVHCSCGDDGDGDPHIAIRYDPGHQAVWRGGKRTDNVIAMTPPELALFSDDGHYEPTFWNRLKSAWHTILGDWPRWPGMMVLLGANERDVEVANARALAA